MKEQKTIKYPKTYRETIGRMLGCFWWSIMGGVELVLIAYSINMIVLYPDFIVAYIMILVMIVVVMVIKERMRKI